MVRSAHLLPVLFGQATLMCGVTNRRLGIRQSAKALRQAPSRHLRIHRGSPNDLRVYFIPFLLSFLVLTIQRVSCHPLGLYLLIGSTRRRINHLTSVAPNKG